jgi:hypothetical protein
MNRPVWISAETTLLLDLYQEAAVRLRDGYTAERMDALQQAEEDMLEAIRQDALRSTGRGMASSLMSNAPDTIEEHH